MLTSRVYLGEIHFGKLANLSAHGAIIDRDVWKAAQRPARGIRAKSDRLLARLGVLKCGTCGARMTVGHVRSNRYPFYRCPPTGDCAKRQTISAAIVEGAVVDELQARYADLEGRAAADQRAQAFRVEADRAQANLDAAIRAFDGVGDEPMARERLMELRDLRDQAAEKVGHSGSHSVVLNLGDWDRLIPNEQRAIVLANFAEIRVGPGRGRDRLVFEFRA